MLDETTGKEIHDLWYEFEDGQTAEARFARALDNLEVQIQHNLAPLETWEDREFELVYTKMDHHCSHDAFLQNFCKAVIQQSEDKMRSAGLDLSSLKKKLGLG